MTDRMSLEVVGLDDLLKDAERMGAQVQPLVRSAIVNSLDNVQSEVRSRAAHRTGTLQRSVLTQINYPYGQVMVDVKYGTFLEEGTGIYGTTGSPITPKNSSVLVWGKGDNLIFARSVKGMRAQPFFKPGVQAAEPYVVHQFDDVMYKILFGLGGR